MATFKKEHDLWRATDSVQRARLLEQYADLCWVMIDLQQTRIAYWQKPDHRETAMGQLVKQRIDVDMFIMALHRLAEVANVVQETADPGGVMPAARAPFDEATKGLVLDPQALEPVTITNVRNALEHFLNLKITEELGFTRASYGWHVSYRDKQFSTDELFEAAAHLHQAIISAVFIEASSFPEVTGQADLRDPWGLGPVVGRVPGAQEPAG